MSIKATFSNLRTSFKHMNQTTRYFIYSFCLMTLVSCNKLPPGFNTYDIQYADRITFDKDMRVYFRDVKDLRCPPEEDCQADEVKVTFEAIREQRDTIRFDLHLGTITSGPSDTIIFDKYRFEILDVMPLPWIAPEFIKEDYNTRFLVDKFKR